MQFLIESGPRAGDVVEAELPFVIGRTRGELRLPDGHVSRQHAQLAVIDSRLVLTDLQSRNGTYLNDQRISHTAEVLAGDRIRVGLSTLAVLATSPSSPPPEAPPPPVIDVLPPARAAGPSTVVIPRRLETDAFAIVAIRDSLQSLHRRQRLHIWAMGSLITLAIVCNAWILLGSQRETADRVTGVQATLDAQDQRTRAEIVRAFRDEFRKLEIAQPITQSILEARQAAELQAAEDRERIAGQNAALARRVDALVRRLSEQQASMGIQLQEAIQGLSAAQASEILPKLQAIVDTRAADEAQRLRENVANHAREAVRAEIRASERPDPTPLLADLLAEVAALRAQSTRGATPTATAGGDTASPIPAPGRPASEDAAADLALAPLPDDHQPLMFASSDATEATVVTASTTTRLASDAEPPPAAAPAPPPPVRRGAILLVDTTAKLGGSMPGVVAEMHRVARQLAYDQRVDVMLIDAHGLLESPLARLLDTTSPLDGGERASAFTEGKPDAAAALAAALRREPAHIYLFSDSLGRATTDVLAGRGLFSQLHELNSDRLTTIHVVHFYTIQHQAIFSDLARTHRGSYTFIAALPPTRHGW